MQTGHFKGVLVMLVTVLVWGGMFPVAKDALVTVDAFWLSSIRYGISALCFAAILRWREGPGALAYRGRFLKAAFYGVIGFSGFSILVFLGLARTRPEHAAIIMSLQTPIAAFLHWALRGARPANFTLGCVSVAVVGVLLVVTKGDLAATFSGDTIVGDAIIFVAALSWITYTIGAVSFPGWSALRFTVLTSLPGTAGIFAITALATLAGYASVPALATVTAVAWEIFYLSVLVIVLAVLFWNMAIGYMGALNTMLLGNLVPVVTFIIRILQGYRFAPIELAGAGLVVGALIANNLYLRHAPAARA